MAIVTIIYPTDPLGIVAGGTDTCIRDILRSAPPDIQIRLVGVTTDVGKFPLRTWTRAGIDDWTFDFYPLFSREDLNQRKGMPLSLRFTLALIGQKAAWQGSDALQFHRIEPALVCGGSKMPKVLFVHTNMENIRNAQSDIRWKHLPGVYFALEDLLLPRFARVYVVREDAAAEYRRRFPAISDRIRFLPTWMNPSHFYASRADERRRVKHRFLGEFGWAGDETLLLFVGRLDHSKNPLMLIEAVAPILRDARSTRLLMIGEGVLRASLQRRVDELNIRDCVKFLGSRPQAEVADWMRVSDMLLLSSAYEGMPRCVVEALGCGVPVATTDVGEVRKLVIPGVNGTIATANTESAFREAIRDALERLDEMSGKPCTDAVKDFTAPAVLEQVYESYRQLAR